MKKIIIILICVIMCVSLVACGQEEAPVQQVVATYADYAANSYHLYPMTDENFRYALYDKYAEIIECINPNLEEVVIPNTIQAVYEPYEVLPVISIAPGVFRNMTSIKKVTLGKNTLNVGENAFSGCTSLAMLVMSGSLQTMGSGAFSNCTALNSVVIPPMVNEVVSGTFSGCVSLTKVIVEDNPNATVVRALDGGSFSGCSRLSFLWIPDAISVDSNITSGSRPTVYSGKSTSASWLATQRLFDFKLANIDEFDVIARTYRTNSLKVESDVGKLIKGSDFSIQIDDVNYFSRLGGYEVNEDRLLAAIKITIYNDDVIDRYFDGMDGEFYSLGPGQDGLYLYFQKYPKLISKNVIGYGYPDGIVPAEGKLEGVIVLEVSRRFVNIVLKIGGVTLTV